MAIDEVNLNFGKLGKSMKNYALGSIIIYVVSIIVGVFSGIAMVGITMTSNPEQALYDLIGTLKFVIIFSGAINIIIYFLYWNFIKEISIISKNNNQHSGILHKISLFLLFGLISQILVEIVAVFISYQSFSEIQQLIPSFISMSETEYTQALNQMLNQVNATAFIVKIFKLIPFTLFLIGYITFEKFGNQIKMSNLENPNSINVYTGIKFLLWASIINLVNGLWSLIPNAPFITIITIASLILTIVGLYKAGNGFLLYSQTRHLNRSPEMYSSQYSTQNIYSQEQTGYSNQNSPQGISGEEGLKPDVFGKSCHICGANQVDVNAKYCSNCGTPLD